MKISVKSLNSFNQGKEPVFNEAYNSAHGVHSMKEHAFLSRVSVQNHGLFRYGKRVTSGMIREYLQNQGA